MKEFLYCIYYIIDFFIFFIIILLILSSTVLAGRGKADVPSSGPFDARAHFALLREVLHAGSRAPRRGVHSLPILPASEARPGERLHPV